MIEEYKIVEYVNRYFPTIKHYKCRIDDVTYHSTNLLKVANWKNERIWNAKYYNHVNEVNQKATASFFEGSTISKD